MAEGYVAAFCQWLIPQSCQKATYPFLVGQSIENFTFFLAVASHIPNSRQKIGNLWRHILLPEVLDEVGYSSFHCLWEHERHVRLGTRPPPSVDYNLIKNRKFQDGSQNFLEKINPKVLKFLQNHPYMLFRKYIVILADNYKFGVNDEKLWK